LPPGEGVARDGAACDKGDAGEGGGLSEESSGSGGEGMAEETDRMRRLQRARAAKTLRFLKSQTSLSLLLLWMLACGPIMMVHWQLFRYGTWYTRAADTRTGLGEFTREERNPAAVAVTVLAGILLLRRPDPVGGGGAAGRPEPVGGGGAAGRPDPVGGGGAAASALAALRAALGNDDAWPAEVTRHLRVRPPPAQTPLAPRLQPCPSMFLVSRHPWVCRLSSPTRQ